MGHTLRFLYRIGELIAPYLSFIFVIIFIVPWINGKLQFHNSSDVLVLVEVFVLSSATLSLLTFTYIVALTDLHEKVKKSMVIAGEAYFVATVQFIAGLALFMLVNLTVDHFINQNTLTLSFSLGGVLFIVLSLIQLIGIYEVASALSKFIRGVFEVYKSFRVLRRPRLYTFLKEILGM
ncbi:MAG: hypothetical protein KO316_04995 [Methanobacterium sp.]|jgi:hypothetical protein|nr:hypothetical protein [Methanobacterium sp.]